MSGSPADSRRSAPAALRNRDPILHVLRTVLPPSGLVLEVGSGTGEHVVYFARGMPGLEWQPSDPDPDARASIEGWIAESGLTNVRPPLDIDAAGDSGWPEAADAILCINMVHIAPWAAAEGLMRAAGRLLPPGGLLFLYGPYRERYQPLAPSNAAFDADLRRRDPAWGLREVEEVADVAARHGLLLERKVVMPANNLSLVFYRGDAPGR